MSSLEQLKKPLLIPYLEPSNFVFEMREGTEKERFTGFAVDVKIVLDHQMPLEKARQFHGLRRLMAPEVRRGHMPNEKSASYSLFQMMLDLILNSEKLKLLRMPVCLPLWLKQLAGGCWPIPGRRLPHCGVRDHEEVA